MVVDDDISICELLEEAIMAKGYKPLICNHPEEALATSERETFGLAFVDINLPAMSGLDLATKLKGHDPQREIVFITGFGTFDSAVRAIKIGAYDYLRKPFSINDFNLCLKRFQEREALKEKVRLAEQRYFHLVQNIPLLIYVLRRDLRLDFINDACSEMLGFTPDEAIHIPNWLIDRVCSNDRERIKTLIQSALDPGGTSFSTECRLIRKNGNMIHTILKSIPHFQVDNKVDHLECIMVDITDRVFLEKAVVQREKLKTLGSISAEVAHEIRNPLVSIGGFARRLQKKNPQLTEGAIILNEAQRLEKMLDRIMDYLKPVEISTEECSINEVMNYCVKLLSPAFRMNEIIYHLDLSQGLPTVYADRDMLTQVFINLIRNAINGMEKGGNLFIKTSESDQNLHVDIRNQILQKKAEDPEKLFLPFDEGGESIGLPLSYKLVRNMGGLLSYEHEGDYSLFTVSLPKPVDTKE